MTLRSKVLLCCCWYSALCNSSEASQFIPLGPGSATGVDATGHTVVGQSFIWQQSTGMQPLEISNSAVLATGITPDGQTIVGRARTPQSPPDGVSFVTSTTQGFTLIDKAAVPFPGSEASDVSADGNIVVGDTATASKYMEAYRWTQQDGLETLGDLPGRTENSWASAISPDGSVIVGTAGWPIRLEAFRWTKASGMVGLGDLPGGSVSSRANGVSDNGKVIVGNSSSAGASSSVQGTEAFRWEQTSGMVGLGFLSSISPTSDAISVTPDGSAIVGSSGEYDLTSAFVWDAAHGMRSLQKLLNAGPQLIGDLTGWTLKYAVAISANGKAIAGNGVNRQGQNEAFLVLLDAPLGVPEPNSLVMCIGLCAMSLGALRKVRYRISASRRASR